jgi:hypothetical protein
MPCAACGLTFTPKRPNYRASLRVCSRHCVGTLGAAAQHRQHSMKGEHNPNFKGWASRRCSVYVRRFRVQHPEKAAVQHVVSAAIRRGGLVRPSVVIAASSASQTRTMTTTPNHWT